MEGVLNSVKRPFSTAEVHGIVGPLGGQLQSLTQDNMHVRPILNIFIITFIIYFFYLIVLSLALQLLYCPVILYLLRACNRFLSPLCYNVSLFIVWCRSMVHCACYVRAHILITLIGVLLQILYYNSVYSQQI